MKIAGVVTPAQACARPTSFAGHSGRASDFCLFHEEKGWELGLCPLPKDREQRTCKIPPRFNCPLYVKPEFRSCALDVARQGGLQENPKGDLIPWLSPWAN
jgi:hypothetical protein